MTTEELVTDEDNQEEEGFHRRGNTLALWGNLQSMNLNSMLLTNILQSPYFKTQLVELTSYHEVIDEIYYKVEHLEPWERGSRRTGGQTGMCGGVRGVGAGGIVSTPYCLLYKLFTLKLTKKQLYGMLDHGDSPYIRALGFMYIRYCLNPQDLMNYYEPYMDDEEELDVKAGGGCTMTIGEMLTQWLQKLDWFSTLFPRIPVPVQKKIEVRMRERRQNIAVGNTATRQEEERTNEEFPTPIMTADGVGFCDNGAGSGGHKKPLRDEGKDSKKREVDEMPEDRVEPKRESKERRDRPERGEYGGKVVEESRPDRSNEKEGRKDHRHRSRSRERHSHKRSSSPPRGHRRSPSPLRGGHRRSPSPYRRHRDSSPHRGHRRSRSPADRRRESSYERALRKERERQKRHR